MMPGDKVIYEVNPEYLARSPIAADEELYVTKVSPFMVELSDSTVSFSPIPNSSRPFVFVAAA